MRRYLLLIAGVLFSFAARAQIPVTDGANIAQSIVNSFNQVMEVGVTAERMLDNFKQTVKIYEQGKAHYDRLRGVTNLVREGRKVQESILLVGELSDIYVKNFDKMLVDKNFTPEELSAIAEGYSLMLQRGANTLRDLKEVVNPTELSMTDKERMDRIDRAYEELTHTRDLMIYFTRKNITVSYLRSQENNDTSRVLELYGSQEEKYW